MPRDVEPTPPSRRRPIPFETGDSDDIELSRSDEKMDRLRGEEEMEPPRGRESDLPLRGRRARPIHLDHGGDNDPADDSAAEPGEEAGYRRRSRPLRVRKTKSFGDRLRMAGGLLRRAWPLLLILLAAALAERYFTTSPDFTLADSDHIEIAGAAHVTARQVDDVFAADLGRNIYFIPLEQRRLALEALPWIQSASVLRLWPNRLQVRLIERVPVAFARIGDHLMLVDADGVLLDRPEGGSYNLPVLTGLAGTGDDPASEAMRRSQLRQFQDFARALDADGGHHSLDFSEIDVSDPSDITGTLVPPGSQSPIVLHLGNRDYLQRFRLYLAHVRDWQQSFPALASVDLRYDGQAIINNTR
jgi:cell division protein FtsQ